MFTKHSLSPSRILQAINQQIAPGSVVMRRTALLDSAKLKIKLLNRAESAIEKSHFLNL